MPVEVNKTVTINWVVEIYCEVPRWMIDEALQIEKAQGKIKMIKYLRENLGCEFTGRAEARPTLRDAVNLADAILKDCSHD
jgi:hypothetical protein